ncbi:MAG: efflux transporter outer membrane subunit [Parachlamydiaceae bacterium]|nr:efflux transporter outer membrane subunit [Parachlamydiaceae bacterium]
MYKGLGILILACMLMGCFRPNYQPQYVDIPSEWRLTADEGSTLCNVRWWEQFNDPVLDNLILSALANNQNLKIAINRVFEYYNKLGVVNANLYPAVTGNASYQRIQTSAAVPISLAPGFQRIYNNYQAFFNLNWELDFWGRLASASEAAYGELLGTIEARRAVVLTVVASVADAYINLRNLDSQLEVSKKTQFSREESLKLALSRFELGETSELEVKQAEAELEIALIRVIEFEKAIPIQENQLSILLGENPHAIVRGIPIESFQYPPLIPAGLPSELLSRRPDILQAEDQLITANARVTESKALFFPQISLTGMYGSQSSDLKRFLTAPSEMWQYGFNAVQTIFDAGRILFLVEGAKSIREEALANYRQVILNAFSEVNNALVTTQKNQELLREHRKQVQILIDYLHLAQLRYFEGEVDFLNVLDAERLLFDAQLALVQSFADNSSAVVELYKSLGGGWVSDADNVAVGADLQ